MAEVCRLQSLASETKDVIQSNIDERFCVLNVFCVFVSLVTILADLTTEVLVLAEYCKNGYIYWAVATLVFLLVPNLLINIFSMRWIVIDQISKGRDTNLRYWITHCFLIGLFERYTKFLLKTFSCKNEESIRSKKIFSERNDLCLLHFLYAFTGTVPQIIFQSHAIIVLPDNHQTKVLSLMASAASVIWACASYVYSMTSVQNINFPWISVFFKLLWHLGMLIARISAIVLFITMFGQWTFVLLGLHWAAMTLWIVTQKTTFCSNKLEETFYNVVMGFVYCFCFINLQNGHTRYRLLVFYSLLISQNFGSLFLYILHSDFERQNSLWSIIATAAIVMGTFTGICGMVLYYRWFHEKGPINWKNMRQDVELNNKVPILNINNTQNNKNIISNVRSFKSQKVVMFNKNKRNQDSLENVPTTGTADKRFLLEHWIARAGSPSFVSAPITNNSLEASSIEIHTVENTPIKENEKKYTLNKSNFKTKKRVVYPEELRAKLSSIENFQTSIDAITSSNLNLNKRRANSSSEEIQEDYNNIDLDVRKISDNETDCVKTSSDSIDMDLDLSLSDINSSDINTFNENIVQKLCLSALKNIKFGNQDADIENIQRIALDILKEMYIKKEKSDNTDEKMSNAKQRDLDTPTEALSVHDYENICAVNIAREAWGLRSWNGYLDIENWLHDGSVFRDKRRDTLTSASSEISSCISQELKSYILSAASFPKKTPTYSNVSVKYNKDDYANVSHSEIHETYLARPCMVDIKDVSQLEPIEEELDDLGEITDFTKKQKLNSESTLVATIDEIRKVTVTNSPRNLYHRREHVWDSPQLTNTTKMESNIKRALWKEPSIFDSNNVMKSLTEKENDFNFIQGSKLAFKFNEQEKSSASTLSVQENQPSVSNSRKIKTSNISNSSRSKKVNNNKPDKIQDLSNKDIDFLWKMVSENTITAMPVPYSEEISSNQTLVTSSMQSLIVKEPIKQATQTKINNVKKGKSKPRRKFSVLRENCEPKVKRISDEEKFYQNPAVIPNVVKLKNDLVIDENISKNEEKNRNLAASYELSQISKRIREKRTAFMKHVLSPPKFNTKLRHKI